MDLFFFSFFCPAVGDHLCDMATKEGSILGTSTSGRHRHAESIIFRNRMQRTGKEIDKALSDFFFFFRADSFSKRRERAKFDVFKMSFDLLRIKIRQRSWCKH